MGNKQKKLNIALIGLGYWGPKLLSALIQNPFINVKYICDLKRDKTQTYLGIYPNLKGVENLDEALNDKEIDAIAIATPTSSHYQLAKRSLEAGKHVLVEKPITENSKQALELCLLAESKNLILMVDHIYLFNGATLKIKELIENGTLGSLYYLDAVRVNLGLFQHDSNVLWDLAPHDISIIDFLIDKAPKSVIAVGTSHVQPYKKGKQFEEIAYITLLYESNFVAHIHLNWLSPVKVRRILIGGDKKMVVWNDLLPDEKIKIYDHGLELPSHENNEQKIHEALVNYRLGDVLVPSIDREEPLKKLVFAFADSIQKGTCTISNGYTGYRVASIIEACQQSIENGFREVKLDEIQKNLALINR